MYFFGPISLLPIQVKQLMRHMARSDSHQAGTICQKSDRGPTNNAPTALSTYPSGELRIAFS